MTKPHRLLFTDNEYALISELLTIAQQSLLETVQTIAHRCPGSQFEERLRIWVEQAADLRERIEGR